MDKLQVWSNANNHQEQEEPTVNGNCNPPGYPWSLLDVLSASRQLEASEPKDYIYAFLGHPSASQALTGELIVNPDYAIDTMQTYCGFAIGWLEWTQDLNILSFVQHKDVSTLDTLVPSWVPMWNAYDASVLAQNGESIFSAVRQARPRYSCSNMASVWRWEALFLIKSFFVHQLSMKRISTGGAKEKTGSGAPKMC